jgi:hypothetical protein
MFIIMNSKLDKLSEMEYIKYVISTTKHKDILIKELNNGIFNLKRQKVITC